MPFCPAPDDSSSRQSQNPVNPQKNDIRSGVIGGGGQEKLSFQLAIPSIRVNCQKLKSSVRSPWAVQEKLSCQLAIPRIRMNRHNSKVASRVIQGGSRKAEFKGNIPLPRAPSAPPKATPVGWGGGWGDLELTKTKTAALGQGASYRPGANLSFSNLTKSPALRRLVENLRLLEIL